MLRHSDITRRFFGIVVFLSFLVLTAACTRKVSANHARLHDITGGEQPEPPPPSVLEYPGLIPLDGMRSAASDLVYEGEVITSEAAADLRDNGVDLTKLDPREDTDLWRNTIGGPLNPDDDAMSITDNDDVEFQGFLTNLSSTKNARFGVRKDVDGSYQSYTLSIGRQAHDVLLRRSLLRKLGYLIEPTSFLSRITLHFSNIREVEIFKKRIAEDTVADPARWLVSEPDELTLVVQDVVAVNAQVTKYNLANGRVSGRVGGRRLMRSLLIPFSLVSMGENVNLFSWVPGRIFDRHVIVNYDSAQEFDCAHEDAVWALRRIAALTRQDFEDVAHSAGLPDEVAKLLTEKLIARRNTMLDLFGMEENRIAFNQKISSGERLVDGEIVGENFQGHGERFSYGDPESPLSSQEVWAFIKSKAISSAFANGIDFLNEYLPNTDLPAAILAHKTELLNRAIKQYMTTGTFTEMPIGAYIIPTVGSSLILSRDVVVGTYMGIDNKVSLADTVGVNVSTGAFIGYDSMPTPVTVAGGAKAFYRRTYTHLKPINSIKAAIRAPFRNIIVPLLEKDLSDSLAELTEENLDTLTIDARREKIKKVITAFKENMAVGESIIVTDSVGGDITAQAGRSFFDGTSVNAAVGAEHVVIGRMHIQRVAEETIVISDGKGNISAVNFASGVNALFVPVLRVGIRVSKGSAKTDVVPLNLDADERRNPNLLRGIAAIRNALSHGSIAPAKQVVPGFTLTHKFQDTKATMMFLFNRYAQINGAVSVEVQDNASGASKIFYQRRIAQRWGTDFQSFTVDGINGILAGIAKVDLSINAPASDPAGSVGGKSYLREFIYEGAVEPAAENTDISRITDGFFSMQYRWRGWSMERKELDRVVNAINKKFNHEFYPETVLGNADTIQFYDITTRAIVSPAGLHSIVGRSAGDFRAIFDKYLDDRVIRDGCDYESSTHRDDYCRAFSQFLWFKAHYGGEWVRGNNEKAASHLLNAISAVEGILNPEDFIEVLGGEKSVFVVSRIEGFRKGDEAGDTAIIGNTFGRIGTMNPVGPINALAKKLSIPVSEMMATWIRESL